MAVAKVNALIKENPLMVFSKSYCPYCKRVKELFKSLGANAKVIELDQEKDGAELQKALAEISNQRTVPNVFISGEHLGGSDATVAANKKGDLVPMLKKAGVLKDETSKDPAVQDLLKDVKEESSVPVKTTAIGAMV